MTNKSSKEKVIRLLKDQLAHSNKQNQHLSQQIESLTRQVQPLTKLLCRNSEDPWD